MLQFVMQLAVVQQARWRAPEPGLLAGGAGILGAAGVLPALWSRGLNPMPPCLFHLATGQPCPFCGGTRSFVAMMHGDIGLAATLYPIGPLLFLALLVVTAYAAGSLVSGRRVRARLDRRTTRALIVVGVAVLALNWAAKLFVLGYGPVPF
jgi:hypothetical protein